MKLRMSLIFSTVAILLSLFALAALADTDIDQHRDCKQCGMDRKAYGYSRMLIIYQDGSQTGVCSLHCAVTELDANKGRTAKTKDAAQAFIDKNGGKLVSWTDVLAAAREDAVPKPR